MARTYKFAVLRATPDPRKGEVINVGIVVFHPETTDIRIAPSLKPADKVANVTNCWTRSLPGALPP